jgi:hypothetical protein
MQTDARTCESMGYEKKGEFLIARASLPYETRVQIFLVIIHLVRS